MNPSLGTSSSTVTGLATLLACCTLGLPLWAQDAPAPSSPGEPPAGAVRVEYRDDAWRAVLDGDSKPEQHAAQDDPLVGEGLTGQVADGEGGFVVMVLRRTSGSGTFVFESIDVDLSPTALEAGLAGGDLDEREAYLDDLISRLAVRDDASSAAKRWLRAQATGTGELAWTARTALRELDRRGAFFGGGGGEAELDPLIHVLGTGPTAPVLHVGADRVSTSVSPGEPTLRAFLTRTEAQSSSVDPTYSWRFVSGADAQELSGTPATRGLQTSAPTAALPNAGLVFEEARTVDRLPGREQRAGGLVERERVNVFPVADLDAFEDYTLELRCGPGNVNLRVLEVPEARPTRAPGEQEYTAQVREYHSTSLPDLLERHPELSGLLPFRSQTLAPAERLPRADVLGVYVQAVAPDESVELLTADGELVHAGMRVVRVQPGTIAESMGVANGSLILTVCDYPIIDGQAISRALEKARTAAETGAGVGAIEVEWRDPWGRRQSRVWRGQLAR